MKCIERRNFFFQQCFVNEGSLTYCKDLNRLFTLFKYPHNPGDWRLFIDSSKSGLKVVLLHNGNEQPSVPLAYSTKMKETRENMRLILEKLNYQEHKWRICSDLKVVGLLIGLKKANAGHPCFLCVWDHTIKSKHLHYTDHEWPKRPDTPKKGEYSIDEEGYLVNPNNIIFPALHIELGAGTQLIATLVKSLKPPKPPKPSKKGKNQQSEKEDEGEKKKMKETKRRKMQ